MNEEGRSEVNLIWYDWGLRQPQEIPQLGTEWTGSGIVLSPDGHIVTNAHVLDLSDDELKDEFAYQAALWALDLLYGADAWTTYEYDEEMYEDFQRLYDTFMEDYDLEYAREIRVYFGGPGSTSSSPKDYHPAKTVKISPREAWFGTHEDCDYRPGKDLAVIEVEVPGRLPNAVLGDSDRVEVGDEVVVIGYPGPVSSWQNGALSPETDHVPTITSGIISAKRRLLDGTEVFQTDAMIYLGNSGGPVLDVNGEVIGMVTFGSGDYTEISGDWIDAQGYNFLIPINAIKGFVSDLELDTGPSETTRHILMGLDHYWNGECTEAKREFEQAQALDPEDLYASAYAMMSGC